jgi:hypothetical protein
LTDKLVKSQNLPQILDNDRIFPSWEGLGVGFAIDSWGEKMAIETPPRLILVTASLKQLLLGVG